MRDAKFEDDRPKPLRLTEPELNWGIGEALIHSVISAAVWLEGQRPGVWQRMIQALHHGAGKTQEGTASAFLFRAMTDRLLEEFHALETDEGGG